MASPARSDRLQRALAETDAMRAVAEILHDLPDDEARARVLRWCQEHFSFTAASGSPRSSASRSDDRQRPAGPSGGAEPDPALTVGEDVFDAPRRKRQPVADDDRTDDVVVPERIHCDDSVDVPDREPISEDDLAVDGLEPVDPEPEPQRPATSGTGLESILRDFVADFQRLALAFA